jgi:hypothetical protein
VESSEFEVEALSRRVESAKREVGPGNSEADPVNRRVEAGKPRHNPARLEV